MRGVSKRFVIPALVVGLLLFVSFVFAAHTVTFSSGSGSFSVLEDVYNIFNVSVANSDTGLVANVSQVNITVPGAFSVVSGSNGTSAGSHTFSSSSTILSWSGNNLVMNSSTEYFWFNASVATPGSYTLSVVSTNASGSFTSSLNVTVNDTTAPGVSASTVSGSNKSGSFSFSMTVSDNVAIDSVWLNVTNASSGLENATFTATNTSATAWSVTIDTTAFIDGVYNISVIANDTSGNINSSVSVDLVSFDNTDPYVSSFSCTPSTVNVGDTVSCSCSAGDNFTGLASKSFTASPSTTTLGTQATTCTATDYAGNTAQSSVEYEVESSSSGGGGGGGVRNLPKRKGFSWSKLTPGSATILKDFDSDFGLSQISISVNNPSQNVQVTVRKFFGKPAQVSVAKVGSVYKYLEIDTANLESLDSATVTLKVEKSWLDGKGLGRDEIGLSKFDESAGEWVDLDTVFVTDDASYNYYDADLTSFSYFAISERSVAQEGGSEAGTGSGSGTSGSGTGSSSGSGTGSSDESSGAGVIWFIIILLLVGSGVAYYFLKVKKAKH